MERPLKCMLRPSLIANAAECKQLGIPDIHEHPNYRKMPANVRFPIVFAHPMSLQKVMRCLVLWKEKQMAWWIDVPFERFRRLPRIKAEDWEYRL